MKARGYGSKTFLIETDAQGAPQVHQVDGKHPDSHYLDDTHVVYEEIGQVFDLWENIYLVVVDNSTGVIGLGGGRQARGTGGRGGKKNGRVLIPGGEALVPGVESYGVVAHELGHAFGLEHDFQDGSYIMSYGVGRQDSTSIDFAPSWSRLSGCSADFLAVHPYLNTDSSLESDRARLPTVELNSPRTYLSGSGSVSMRLDVGASQGLLQATLLAPTRNLSSLEVVDCRGLSGGSEAVVEFEYDGAIPSDPLPSLADPVAHPIHVRVVDSEGDVAGTDFVLAEVSPHQIASLAGHTDEVTSVSFSPDGATLASGSLDGRTILWDVESRGLIATLNGDGVTSVSFSPDGALLASGSWDGRVTLWNVETREQIAPLSGHSDEVASVSFSPDGATLASGSQDGRVILWNLETREQIAPLSGHSDEVASVSFSPDGATLASGSLDRTVILWDVGSRERLGTLEGHVSGVTSVSFSPDGGTLASGSMDPWERTVILWDVQTREQITTLVEHASGVSSLSFASPGGGALASASRDGTVILWDLLTAEKVAAFGLPGEVLSVSLSPGGALMAAGGRDGSVLLWDTSEWTRRRPFELEILSGDGQQGAPGAALAHPLVVEVRDQYGDPLPAAAVTFTVTAGDGKLSGRFTVEQATTDADGRARLTLTLGPREGPNAVGVSIRGLELAAFSAEGVGTRVIGMEGDYRTWHLPQGATVRLGKGAVSWGDRAVAHSADGRYLAVATTIGVWLYEAATSRLLALLPSDYKVQSVAFSLDGTLVAGMYGQVELWEVETGERIGTLSHDRTPSVVFSPDGTTLVSGGPDHVIKLWDWETRRQIGTWEVEGSTYGALPVAFSPDGTRLVAGFDDSTVRLWDVATQKEVASAKKHIGRVNSVSFSPDGALLASAGDFSTATAEPDLTIRLWDAATLEEVGTLRGHERRVKSLAFSRDGATLVSGSLDGTVRLWDVATRRSITTLEHGHRVWTVSYSPDGATLVFVAADGVWLRDMETGSTILLSGHESGLVKETSVALSPDGAHLAAAYEGRVPIKLWDMRTLELAGTLPLEGHGHFLPLAFSPDGTSLAAGSFVSPRVPLWDVATRRLIGTLEGGQGGGVSVIAFSPVDAHLASGLRGGAINLWNVETRQLIATLEGHTTRITAMAFSPDGALLASGGGWDGTVILWDMAGQEPIARFEGYPSIIEALAFSPDGALLASGSKSIVILWDVATRERIATLETQGHSLAFSPDGTILATPPSYDRRQISLWDVATRQITSTLDVKAGGNWYGGLLLSPDGRLIYVVRGTVLVYDLQPAPQTVEDVSGHGQEGVAGAVLVQPFVVEVRDQNGSPLAGTTVTFTVTAGGGTLSATTDTTDADGRALTTLTLGRQPGPNTVQATVDGVEPVTFTATGLAVARTLAKVSGDEQEGAAGGALAEPLVVRVQDQNGNPLAGVAVTFAVTAGGGSLSVTTDTTDTNGRAATTLVLGPDPGPNTVTATVAGLDPVTFSAVGSAIPHSLTKLSGHDQQVAAGTAPTEPFVVEVKDQKGQPLEGAQVTFAVTAGGGRLSATTDTPDADGRASTTLTLGPDPGRNTVVARVGDLKPVIFSATGLAIPTAISRISGDQQQGAAGAALADPLVVEVRDQNNDPLEGAAVSFTITAGDGTLSAATATTDANGRAATTLTLGRDPEAVTVTATVSGLDPVTFTATAEATPDFDGDGETGFSDFFLFARRLRRQRPPLRPGRQRQRRLRRLLPPGRPLRRSGPRQAAGPGPGDDRPARRPAASAERPQPVQQRDRHHLVPAAPGWGASGGVRSDWPASGGAATRAEEGGSPPRSLERPGRGGPPPGQRRLPVPAGDRRERSDAQAHPAAVEGDPIPARTAMDASFPG